MAKYKSKTKQQHEAELLLIENYSLSSSTVPSKNNRRYFLKCTKTSASVLMRLYDLTKKIRLKMKK